MKRSEICSGDSPSIETGSSVCWVVSSEVEEGLVGMDVRKGEGIGGVRDLGKEVMKMCDWDLGFQPFSNQLAI